MAAWKGNIATTQLWTSSARFTTWARGLIPKTVLAIILPCCILPVYAPHLEPRVVAIGLIPAAVLMPIVLLMALNSNQLMAFLSLKMLYYFAAVFSTELLSTPPPIGRKRRAS
jgi:hypothetical protein